MENRGIGELKVTYVNLEGTKLGLELDYSKKILYEMNIPVIFEGGIGKLEHLLECYKINISSVALGTLIIFSDYHIIKIKQYLKNENCVVRI